MPVYSVGLPITGMVYVEVKADNEDDAVEKAFQSDDLSLDNIEEWEPHEKIVEGNIFHGNWNEPEVEER